MNAYCIFLGYHNLAAFNKICLGLKTLAESCIIRGVFIGFIIAGIILFIVGLAFYGWLTDLSNRLTLASMLFNSPAYTSFLDRILDARISGSSVTLDSDTVSNIYPVLSSLKNQLTLIDLGRGGALSNLSIILGLLLSGIGFGGLIGFYIKMKTGDRR